MKNVAIQINPVTAAFQECLSPAIQTRIIPAKRRHNIPIVIKIRIGINMFKLLYIIKPLANIATIATNTAATNVAAHICRPS